MLSFKAVSSSLASREGGRENGEGGERGKGTEGSAIELLMAIIIRCFESLLSLVRATLPASRFALAVLQSYGKKEEKENVIKDEEIRTEDEVSPSGRVAMNFMAGVKRILAAYIDVRIASIRE